MSKVYTKIKVFRYKEFIFLIENKYKLLNKTGNARNIIACKNLPKRQGFETSKHPRNRKPLCKCKNRNSKIIVQGSEGPSAGEFNNDIQSMGIHFNVIFSLQAYAEIEENTPGQIMGVSIKTDGKSATSGSSSTRSTSDESISAKFTQGAREDDNYSKTDETDTHEYRKERLGPNFYFFFGFFLISMGFFGYMIMPNYDDDFDYERQKVIQAREAEERELFEESVREARKSAVQLGPFSDA